MTHLFEEHIGSRVARVRKRRGLTQRELAEKSSVSYSALTKVEQGHLPASPSVTGALARALSVSVAELVGQPYTEELQRDQLDGLIQPIRESLDVYDLGADPDATSRSTAELGSEADTLCRLMRATSIKQVAAVLPALIHEATTAAYRSGSGEAWRTLGSLYRTAYDVATKLGFHDLASIALDRMDWAAGRASDPLLAGLRQYMRALTYLRASDCRTGERLVRLGMSLLDQAEPGRERDVVTGQLHLGAAVVAGRGKDWDAARGHLAEAERIAARTGPAETVYWTSFGPTNVKVHRVSVLAELDQYSEAVQAAQALAVPPDWPLSRRAHHHAEVARALLWIGRTDAAARNLMEARRLAPQQTRYQPMVRETYAGLVAARRACPDSLVSLGAWLGM